MMQRPREIGDVAEDQALLYLQGQGLVLRERNFQIRRGEIDLIMQQGDELVFIEVRARAQSQFGDGAESITYAKRRRLIAAASAYLQRLHYDSAARFDVVSLNGEGRVEWIPDAFRADD